MTPPPEAVQEAASRAAGGATALATLPLLPRYAAPSAWWEHVPLAHWLIARLRPASVVELGSHWGVSFFAFCEAAEAFSPQTFVYAVDSWQGDEHAGSYGGEVYERVRRHQQRHHPQRSRLIRSSFDAAAEHFGAGSVDLLHIDGLHTYEAVRHDHDTWRPKLRAGGTILFHDINVRERDFGVWRLWAELVDDPALRCLALPHGHGLGIATLAPEAPAWHRELEEQLAALAAQGALLDRCTRLEEELAALHGELERRQQRLAAAEAEAQAARREAEAARGETAAAAGRLEQLLASRSWRLGGPLRRLGRSLRALVGRG